MEEHHRIINWLIEHKKFDVELRYNTNFTVTFFQGQDVFELWKKFKKVEVGASLDSFGKRAEYARKDTDWKLVETNRLRMMDVCPDVYFYVSCTLSIFSFTTMAEFQRDWVSRGLIDVNSWNINPLTYPLHYRVNITPQDFRDSIVQKYLEHINWLKNQAGISDIVLERWNAAITFLQSPQLSGQLIEFSKHTKQIDRIRNESFGDVFPEMAFLLNE
jgi:hypothetical protein